jgi:N-methylhydantoinase B
VDAKATEQLRVSMQAERGTVPLFNRGFTSIEELKRRCKNETGIEAPTQPEFTKVVNRREVKAA